jgi:hypothetical protein
MVNRVKPALLKNSLLICAFVAGTLLRFYPVWQAGFVIHDGGMFRACRTQSCGIFIPWHTKASSALAGGN